MPYRYVRHILVQTEEMAKLCLSQLKSGADFAELASSISDCHATRAKGGEVEWKHRSREKGVTSLPFSLPQYCVCYAQAQIHLCIAYTTLMLYKLY